MSFLKWPVAVAVVVIIATGCGSENSTTSDPSGPAPDENPIVPTDDTTPVDNSGSDATVSLEGWDEIRVCGLIPTDEVAAITGATYDNPPTYLDLGTLRQCSIDAYEADALVAVESIPFDLVVSGWESTAGKSFADDEISGLAVKIDTREDLDPEMAAVSPVQIFIRLPDGLPTLSVMGPTEDVANQLAALVISHVAE